MRKIFVHGLSALDLIHTVSDLPKYAEKYKSNSVYVSIGGNAANASVALSRLGVKVFLSTVIGNDEVGKILKQKIKIWIYKKLTGKIYLLTLMLI